MDVGICPSPKTIRRIRYCAAPSPETSWSTPASRPLCDSTRPTDSGQALRQFGNCRILHRSGKGKSDGPMATGTRSLSLLGHRPPTSRFGNFQWLGGTPRGRAPQWEYSIVRTRLVARVTPCPGRLFAIVAEFGGRYECSEKIPVDRVRHAIFQHSQATVSSSSCAVAYI
jgi:hypothetical protein